MDDITQQMNAFALSSGNVNKSDDDDFNAGLFKYLLFDASNVGKEIIVWSETDPELKKWVTKIRSQLTGTMKNWWSFTPSTAIAMCIGPAALASG